MAGTVQFATRTQICNSVKGTHKSNGAILCFMSFSTSTPKKQTQTKPLAASILKGKKTHQLSPHPSASASEDIKP